MTAPAVAGRAVEEITMSPDNDRASKNWYEVAAPVTAAPGGSGGSSPLASIAGGSGGSSPLASTAWPNKLLLDSYELDPTDMRWGPTEGGAPTIYRRTFLTAPA